VRKVDKKQPCLLFECYKCIHGPVNTQYATAHTVRLLQHWTPESHWSQLATWKLESVRTHPHNHTKKDTQTVVHVLEGLLICEETSLDQLVNEVDLHTVEAVSFVLPAFCRGCHFCALLCCGCPLGFIPSRDCVWLLYLCGADDSVECSGR
jgi:hypothetical protein